MKYSFISLLLLILFSPVFSLSQGVCVPKTLKVRRAYGRFLLSWIGGAEPVKDVKIELSKNGQSNKVISSVITGEDGIFSFKSLKKGKYRLKASHPDFIDFYADLKVDSSKPDYGSEIVVSLNFDLTRPCGGTSAAIFK